MKPYLCLPMNLFDILNPNKNILMNGVQEIFFKRYFFFFFFLKTGSEKNFIFIFLLFLKVILRE